MAGDYSTQKKKCRKCGEVKDAADFSRWAKSKDGLKNHCKPCMRKAFSEYHSKNKEARSANHKQWRAENIEQRRAYDAAYYAKNATRICASKTGMSEADYLAWKYTKPALSDCAVCGDKIHGYGLCKKHYLQSYKHVAAAARARRRALVKGSKGEHSGEDIRDLAEKQKGKCAICHERLSAGYHVDHILPLTLGGGNDKHNIQLLCPRCNLSKGAKHPVDYMQLRGFLI